MTEDISSSKQEVVQEKECDSEGLSNDDDCYEYASSEELELSEDEISMEEEGMSDEEGVSDEEDMSDEEGVSKDVELIQVVESDDKSPSNVNQTELQREEHKTIDHKHETVVSEEDESDTAHQVTTGPNTIDNNQQIDDGVSNCPDTANKMAEFIPLDDITVHDNNTKSNMKRTWHPQLVIDSTDESEDNDDARDVHSPRHVVTSMELNSPVPEKSCNEGLKNPSEIVISDSSDDDDVLEGYELTTDNSKDTTSPTLFLCGQYLGGDGETDSSTIKRKERGGNKAKDSAPEIDSRPPSKKKKREGCKVIYTSDMQVIDSVIPYRHI